jgi:hypothetical protein
MGTHSVCLVCVVLLFVLAAAPLAVFAQATSDAAARPRGGLFSEEGATSQPLSLGWFVLGLYVLLGVVFAGASAHLAVQKALPPVPWFFVGFFLNAAGYLILLTRPADSARPFPAGIPLGLQKVPTTHAHDPCPCCGAFNHPAAHYCPCCQAEREPKFESEAVRWRKQREPH